MPCGRCPPRPVPLTPVLRFPCPPTRHPLAPDGIYSGSRQEVLFRCALLSKAALEAPRAVPLPGRGGVLGEDSLLYIANDWHAALVPVYLQVAWLAG